MTGCIDNIYTFVKESVQIINKNKCNDYIHIIYTFGIYSPPNFKILLEAQNKVHNLYMCISFVLLVYVKFVVAR